MTILRGMFAGINYGIYYLIKFIMQGIFDIAFLKLDSGIIGDISRRIYLFLAIFMVFKLTISLIQYMVNPDVMMDKEKGVGKLVVRTITMLALILMLPTFFGLLTRVQTAFLPVLSNVILGTGNDSTSLDIDDNAEYLAVTALKTFYSPCESCEDSDRPAEIQSINDLLDTYDKKVDGIYQYNFNFIVALVVGVVIAIILVLITVKIGIRLFKMFILELIAPIPVMSYIDPKSAKDGAFASWTKQLLSTFLDLFLRLGVVYIVLNLLGHLAGGTLLDPESLPQGSGAAVRKGYLMIFLIIALLMFAKDAPNFIKDAIGVKHDKDTSGGLAAVTGGAMGFATGAVSGAISGRGVRGALTGAMTGMNAGIQGGLTGKKSGAWRAAGDAAIQARTGDAKAKSGILAALQSSASRAQLAREGRKLNLTDDSISAAKENMLNMQGLAAEAQRNWDYGLHTGVFKDLNGNNITMDEAADLVAKTSTASAIASKNYEKANKAGDAYKIGRDFAGDYKKDKKDSKKDYRRGKISKSQYKAKGQFNPDKGKIDR